MAFGAPPGGASWRAGCSAKWMTLPSQSGNMSQLYRGISWISMMAKLAGATTVASVDCQFDRFTIQFASPQFQKNPPEPHDR